MGRMQPTYMPYAEFPVRCLNPVITNVFNTYNPIANQVTSSSTFGPIPFNTTNALQPKHDANALIRVDWHVNDRHTWIVRATT